MDTYRQCKKAKDTPGHILPCHVKLTDFRITRGLQSSQQLGRFHCRNVTTLARMQLAASSESAVWRSSLQGVATQACALTSAQPVYRQRLLILSHVPLRNTQVDGMVRNEGRHDPYLYFNATTRGTGL